MLKEYILLNLLLCSIMSISSCNSLRHTLLSSSCAKSYGTFIMSSSPSVAELLSSVGYGHVVIDMEHSPLDVSSTVQMLRAVDSARYFGNSITMPTHPIVRVPSNDAVMTKRVLDILRNPAGIMFPLIENAEDAKAAVASTRYPNRGGVRGSAHTLVRASSYGLDDNYYYDTSTDLLVILQVESETAIENIPEIASVDGVDCIFLGPLDISCSINKMGQFDDDNGQVMKLIRYAERLVREESIKREKNGKERLILGGFRSPGRSLSDMFSKDVGYQLISGSADFGLLKKAALLDIQDAQSEGI